jgi:hypothetical protein
MNLFNILAGPFVLILPPCLGFSLVPLTNEHAGRTSTTFLKVTGKEIHDSSESTYHKDGYSRSKHPINVPSLLDDEEECVEWILDFATGDELCWSESPKTTTPNYYQTTIPASKKNSRMFQRYVNQHKNVDENLHKGGNARYEQAANVHLLVEDCDADRRFIDFATGDELCWT